MANHKTKTYGLHTILEFGKHKGKRIHEIIASDPTYLYWMYDKEFDLTADVKKASNIRTKERMKEASVKSNVIGYRENNMLNSLVNRLNDKWADHALDEENMDFY